MEQGCSQLPYLFNIGIGYSSRWNKVINNKYTSQFSFLFVWNVHV